MEVFISEKFEAQAVETAKLSKQIDSVQKTLDNKFLRLDMWFDQIEKNSDFRKKGIFTTKVLAVALPIMVVIIGIILV